MTWHLFPDPSAAQSIRPSGRFTRLLCNSGAGFLVFHLGFVYDLQRGSTSMHSAFVLYLGHDSMSGQYGSPDWSELLISSLREVRRFMKELLSRSISYWFCAPMS
jgi:hypothetical protein